MRRTLFTIIIALLGVTGARAQEATFTVDNLIYKVVLPEAGEKYAILSGYENSPEGKLDIPGTISVVLIGTKPTKVPVTMIGEQAFIDREKITEVNIPTSIKSIGDRAFEGCISLTSFNVSSENANFCSENGILFNKDKTTLLQYPPAKADTGYSIPDGVTKIGDGAFYDCNKLTVMTIPGSVTTIGEKALISCTGLTELFVHAKTPPTVGTNAFINVNLAIPVYVPAASLDTYKAAAGWKDFNNLQALVTEFTVNNLKYKITDYIADEVELTGYATKPTGKLYIPTSLTYGSKTYLVTGIKIDAFNKCSEITEVTIPTCVKSIGTRAFSECTSLGNLTIVNGVTSIGNEAFSNCSALTKVTIPESVTSLGQLVFAKCSSLTQATIGNGVTEIRFGLFGDCTALEKVVIGKGVTKIGNVAFANCSKIKEMTVQATVPPTVEYAQSLGTISRDIPVYVPAESLDTYKEANRWKEFTKLQALVTEFTVDNLKYKVTDYIADEVELTGYATEPTGKLDIPASVTYGSKTYRVTSIGFQAFYKCSTLTRVTIPASVTSVDAAVFGKCSSLTQATIGDGLKRISNAMFSGCSALEKLVIGKAVTDIEIYAFKNCSNLKEITVLASNPPSVPPVEVFENVSRDIPVYVPAASLGAYKAANIWQEFTKLQALVTEFTVNNLKYKVTDYIADEVELTGYTTKPTGKLDIPASVTYGSKTYSVTSIVEQAFDGCSALTEVTIPASVTSVGSNVFNGCSSLTQATIGDGLTVISQSMFSGCIALEKLVIGKGVTEINNYAFSNCYNLKEITVLASNPPSVSSYAFYNVSRDIPVYVPLEALSAYKAASVWKGFTNLQPISTEFTVDKLKYNVTDLVANTVEISYGYVKGALNIPATVTYAGTKYKVTSIGAEAFYEADITSLTIPDGITDIKYSAFGRCMELTEVNISKSVTNMEAPVFYYCEALRRINVDAANTAYSSENGVLFNKNKTTLLQYPIGRQETTYTVPSSVTTIASQSFSTCTTLKELTLSKNVSSIEDCAFENCSAITKMTVLATVPPAVGTEPFFGIDKSIPVYVPAASLAAYKTAEVWKEFTNLQAISGTAIDTPSMPESISIQGGMLHNPQQLPVSIYDLTGRLVYSGNATTVELPAGIYVVSCNGASCKAVF